MTGMHPGQAKGMLVAAAGCLLVMAFGFTRYNGDTSGRHLWPTLFVAAAASCVVLAGTMTRLPLLASGVLVPVAFAARVAGLVVDFTNGSRDAAHSAVGASVYVMAGVMVATTWVFVLGPLVSWTEQGSREVP